MRYSRRIKWGILLVTATVLAILLVFFYWYGAGRTYFFIQTLPRYPNAEQITEAFGYYRANTGLQTLYFWTPDNVDNVIAYYEDFTLPFIERDYNFEFGIDSHYRTIFDHSGGQIPLAITREFSGETLYLQEDRRCYYRLQYSCVEVELLDFDGVEQPTLRPRPAPMRMHRTPEPLSSAINGGTLIVYFFYVYAP